MSGCNFEIKVAIISADKDYRSIMDCWKPRLSVSNQLVRCKTLAKAISHVNGENARKELVNERMRILDLQTEFGRYQERKRIVTGITDLFSGTDYENLFFQIVDMVCLSDRPKVLYLNSLKSFGRKTGTEVYRKIKNCAISIQASAHEKSCGMEEKSLRLDCFAEPTGENTFHQCPESLANKVFPGKKGVNDNNAKKLCHGKKLLF